MGFEEFESGVIDDRYGRKKYLIRLVRPLQIQQEIADEDSRCLEIVYEDVDTFFHKEDERLILESLRTNTKRYVEIFTDIAEQLMPKRQKPINAEDVTPTPFRKSASSSRTS
jgi:hypothetical protein